MVHNLLNKWIDFVRDHIYVVTFMLFTALIGLIFVQYRLIKLEADIQRRQFDREINKVLSDMKDVILDDDEVTEKLLLLLGDKVHPISKRDALEEELILEYKSRTDSILRLNNLGYLDYDFAFYQRIEDTIAFSSAKDGYQPDFQRYAMYPKGVVDEVYGKSNFRYGLLFYNKNLFVAYQISSSLLITFIFVLVLLGSFFSTVLVMKRQKQLSKLKNDFINNLTHELKTPIFASSIIYKIIKDKGHTFSKDELDYHLSILEKENKNLKNKVEKVLELTLLERNDPELEWKHIDMHEIIRGKAEIYKLIIGASGGRLYLHLRAHQTLVWGDLMHLGNILDNILDNAIKYSKDAPIINIETEVKEGAFVLKISDQGIGISKENIDFIFDKFYRVSQGNLHATKGFGLGLSYVKMITELHGGSISLKSKLGKGSQVEIRLPLLNQKVTKSDDTENIIGRR